MEKEEVLKAFLRQTKRIPEVLTDYENKLVVDKELGIIYPEIKGISLEDTYRAFNSVFPNLKAFSATFHKSWEVIENTEQEALWAQAVVHYFTTYGFEALNIDADGFTYIPEEIETPTPELNKFKVIKPISNMEAMGFIENALYNLSIGMSMQTIKDIILMAKAIGYNIDINKVRNKETVTYMAFELELIPTNVEAMIRLLNYANTGNTMLIQDFESTHCWRRGELEKKNKDLIQMILACRQHQCASVFHRYTRMFICIKKRGFVNEVNRISKLCDEYWKPKTHVDFITTKITKYTEFSEDWLDDLDFTEIVKIYNSVAYTVYRSEHDDLDYSRMYVIRNGKTWVDTRKKFKLGARKLAFAKQVLSDIKEYLRCELGYKTTVIKDENLDIAFPTSEKTFIGDIPMFSMINTNGGNTVAISWNREDIDLSAMLEDGRKVGWNSRYKTDNHDILFSGDMTRAICMNPECSNYRKTKGQEKGVCPKCGQPLMACEALRMNTDDTVVVMSNLFNIEESELNLIVASLNEDEFESGRFDSRDDGLWQRNGYMIDTNSIIYSAKLYQKTRSETLGVFYKDGGISKFAFAKLGYGNSNVSFSSEVMTAAINCLKAKAESSLKLSDVFQTRTELPEPEYDEDGNEIELDLNYVDLRSPDKATIFSLISEE